MTDEVYISVKTYLAPPDELAGRAGGAGAAVAVAHRPAPAPHPLGLRRQLHARRRPLPAQLRGGARCALDGLAVRAALAPARAVREAPL